MLSSLERFFDANFFGSEFEAELVLDHIGRERDVVPRLADSTADHCTPFPDPRVGPRPINLLQKFEFALPGTALSLVLGQQRATGSPDRVESDSVGVQEVAPYVGRGHLACV